LNASTVQKKEDLRVQTEKSYVQTSVSSIYTLCFGVRKGARRPLLIFSWRPSEVWRTAAHPGKLRKTSVKLFRMCVCIYFSRMLNDITYNSKIYAHKVTLWASSSASGIIAYG